MIMTELLPLKVYLSTLMKADVYSVQTCSFHYIYYIAPMCDSTEYPCMAQQFFSDFNKSYVDKDIHKRVLKKPPY